MKDRILDGVVKGIQEVQHSQDSLETFLEQYMTVEDYEAMRGHLEDFITERSTMVWNSWMWVRSLPKKAQRRSGKIPGTMVSMF